MANKILYESHASSDSVVNVKFDRKRSNIRYQLFYWQFWVEEWSCEETLIFILIVTVLMGKQVLEREEGPGLLQIKRLKLKESKSLNLRVRNEA